MVDGVSTYVPVRGSDYKLRCDRDYSKRFQSYIRRCAARPAERIKFPTINQLEFPENKFYVTNRQSIPEGARIKT